MANAAGSATNKTIFSQCTDYTIKQTSVCGEGRGSEDESDDLLYQLEEVGTVNHQQTRQFFTSLQVLEKTGDTMIQCQLDTGATCNVMTLDELCNIKQQSDPQMDSSTAKLKLYNGTMIPVLGEANLQCKANEKQKNINFKANRNHYCLVTHVLS